MKLNQDNMQGFIKVLFTTGKLYLSHFEKEWIVHILQLKHFPSIVENPKIGEFSYKKLYITYDKSLCTCFTIIFNFYQNSIISIIFML